MSHPEQPNGSAERVETRDAFGESLNGLEAAMGPVPDDLPAEPSEADLDTAERSITGDSTFGGFNEQFRSNEIIYRRKSLEQRAQLAKEKGSIPLEELATTNQAITYHEYFPAIIRDIQDTMRRYQVLRASVPSIPPSLALQELQGRLYMDALSVALRERVAFANALLAEGKAASQPENADSLARFRAQALASPDLSADSRAALEGGDTAAKWERGNALNQAIIDLLSGKAGISGVESGFFPQKMYLELVTLRYKQVLEEQKSVVRSDMSPDDKGAKLQKLAEERRFMTDELLYITDELGTDQMRRAELVTIQHQFGGAFDFAGVRAPNKEQTPEEIRQAMGEHMQRQSEFHLGRMDAFMDAFEGEVLGDGVGVRIEDISNKKGRELVRAVTHGLARLFTIPVPESLGMKESVRNWLSEPLDKAMGWPAGKDTWEELTPEEQAHVEAKARSILDAIRAFDRSKIENFRSTLSLIKTMPTADSLAGTEPVEPLPAERVTDANRSELMHAYGAQTVYLMLFRQLDGDWGAEQPPTGFMGEYATLIGSINENIDVHIDTGSALYQLGANYDQLKNYLLWIAAAAFAGGLIAPAILRQSYRVIRSGGRMVWKGGKWIIERTPKGPLVAVAAAELQMAGTKVAAQELIHNRESEAIALARGDLEALRRGEERDGNKLSPELIERFKKEAAARLFASLLQINQVEAATANPLVSGHAEATPDPLLVFEAFVAANDIMAEFGFTDALPLTANIRIPDDLSLASARCREYASEVKRKNRESHSRAEIEEVLEKGKLPFFSDKVTGARFLKSALDSHSFQREYNRLSEDLDRDEAFVIAGDVAKTLRRIYQLVNAYKPSEIPTSERLFIAKEVIRLTEIPPQKILTVARYIELNEPADHEIAKHWYGENLESSISAFFSGNAAKEHLDWVNGKPGERKGMGGAFLDRWAELLMQRNNIRIADSVFLETDGEGRRGIDRFSERFNRGEQLLKELGANDNGNYFTKQYGFWVNDYLRIRFDLQTGKWMVNLGGLENMQDPASYRVSEWGIPGAGGADKYNALIEKLAKINDSSE